MKERPTTINDYKELARDFFGGETLKAVQSEIETEGRGRTEIGLGNLWRSLIFKYL